MNSSWDPYTQTFNLTRTDSDNVTVALDLVNDFNIQNVEWATIFAVQIGGAGILLLTLGILAKPTARLTLFYINLISLALVIARGVLAIDYITGPWNNAYRYFTMDFSTVPSSSAAKSISQGFLQLAMISCIVVSLVLQMRVVYETELLIRRVATVASGAVAAAVIGIYIKVIYEGVNSVLNVASYSGTTQEHARLLFTLAICFFTIMFLTKLAKAIQVRRRMRMTSFGPLQILFVMGCQCMLFPSVFCVLERVLYFDGMYSFAVFFVIVSLPLSSIWASYDGKNIHTQQDQTSAGPSNFSRSYKSKIDTVATGRSDGGTDLENGITVRVERGYSVDRVKETP
uniref:Pheromone alpha factor receptor n=1 Tax=Morchella semilibera TaxID=62758 RepID=A0A1B0PNB3_9PEZI|nr:pheromone alpha factor receptor [Morchella crassipes]